MFLITVTTGNMVPLFVQLAWPTPRQNQGLHSSHGPRQTMASDTVIEHCSGPSSPWTSRPISTWRNLLTLIQ